MAYHFSHIAAYCDSLGYVATRAYYLDLSNETTQAYTKALEYLALAFYELDKVDDIGAKSDIINARMRIKRNIVRAIAAFDNGE